MDSETTIENRQVWEIVSSFDHSCEPPLLVGHDLQVLMCDHEQHIVCEVMGCDIGIVVLNRSRFGDQLLLRKDRHGNEVGNDPQQPYLPDYIRASIMVEDVCGHRFYKAKYGTVETTLESIVGYVDFYGFEYEDGTISSSPVMYCDDRKGSTYIVGQWTQQAGVKGVEIVRPKYVLYRVKKATEEPEDSGNYSYLCLVCQTGWPKERGHMCKTCGQWSCKTCEHDCPGMFKATEEATKALDQMIESPGKKPVELPSTKTFFCDTCNDECSVCTGSILGHAQVCDECFSKYNPQRHLQIDIAEHACGDPNCDMIQTVGRCTRCDKRFCQQHFNEHSDCQVVDPSKTIRGHGVASPVDETVEIRDGGVGGCYACKREIHGAERVRVCSKCESTLCRECGVKNPKPCRCMHYEEDTELPAEEPEPECKHEAAMGIDSDEGELYFCPSCKKQLTAEELADTDHNEVKP